MKKAASIFGLGLRNALGCGLAVAGAPAPHPGPPNVVRIFVDDSLATDLFAQRGFRLWDTVGTNLVAQAEVTNYTPDLFADRALRFLEHHRPNRFFLYLPFTTPHANSSMNRIDAPEIEPEYFDKPCPETVVLAVNPARALDFGALPVGKPPVTLTFSVSNAATGYASLMSGTVSASVTDPRLSAQIGGYGPLVAGGTSATFSVTFHPSSFAPLTNQCLANTMTTGSLEFGLVTLVSGKTN